MPKHPRPIREAVTSPPTKYSKEHTTVLDELKLVGVGIRKREQMVSWFIRDKITTLTLYPDLGKLIDEDGSWENLKTEITLDEMFYHLQFYFDNRAQVLTSIEILNDLGITDIDVSKFGAGKPVIVGFPKLIQVVEVKL